MRIVQHGKGLETTAGKTNGCAFCGTRLYLQQPFWQPVVGDVYGCGTDVPGYLKSP